MQSDGEHNPLPLGLREIGFLYLRGRQGEGGVVHLPKRKPTALAWQTAHWDSRELNTSTSKQSLKALGLTMHLQGTNGMYPDFTIRWTPGTHSVTVRAAGALENWNCDIWGIKDKKITYHARQIFRSCHLNCLNQTICYQCSCSSFQPKPGSFLCYQEPLTCIMNLPNL